MTLLLGSPLCYVYPVVTHFKCDLYFKFSFHNIPCFNLVGQGHSHSDSQSNWDNMFEYLNIISIYSYSIPQAMFLNGKLTRLQFVFHFVHVDMAKKSFYLQRGIEIAVTLKEVHGTGFTASISSIPRQ